MTLDLKITMIRHQIYTLNYEIGKIYDQLMALEL